MRFPIDVSTLILIAGSEPAGGDLASAVATMQRRGLGRAYRTGRLVCGWVQVTIGNDQRIGLTEQERQLVRVRFHEPLDDGLRFELTQLIARRGAAARRAAERIDPIEIVVDDPQGARERIIGRVEPPQMRHGRLRDIEFALRKLEPAR